MEALKNFLPPSMYDIIERHGICTHRQIVTLSTWDIKKATNMKDEDVYLLKKIVTSHICPELVTADKLDVEKHIKTGCLSIDKILNGGFRIGTLTELYGESGTGKTQLAMQVAAQCGKDGSVYICTEDVFPIKRFNQLTENFQQQSSNYDQRQHMFIEHITESQDLISCIRVRLPKLLKNTKISVIIIDSVAAPFRVDITNYVQRAEELKELGILLLNVAQKHNIAIICINQVTSSFNEFEFDHVLPSLGLAWSNLITYRLLLKRSQGDPNRQDRNQNVRELRIVFGPDLENKMCKFIIDSKGLKCL